MDDLTENVNTIRRVTIMCLCYTSHQVSSSRTCCNTRKKL